MPGEIRRCDANARSPARCGECKHRIRGARAATVARASAIGGIVRVAILRLGNRRGRHSRSRPRPGGGTARQAGLRHRARRQGGRRIGAQLRLRHGHRSAGRRLLAARRPIARGVGRGGDRRPHPHRASRPDRRRPPARSHGRAGGLPAHRHGWRLCADGRRRGAGPVSGARRRCHGRGDVEPARVACRVPHRPAAPGRLADRSLRCHFPVGDGGARRGTAGDHDERRQRRRRCLHRLPGRRPPDPVRRPARRLRPRDLHVADAPPGAAAGPLAAAGGGDV